ncbi:MAG: hypothetical protein L6R38_002678 [Xanthoria sp. 2 TBL-2021]|nr:MAG: hypothetical protein L6R38_002678 [Xanthoria sp. 2 TBL-2021]
MPQASDTHTKNNDNTKDMTTKEAPTNNVIPKDTTTTKEQEFIYPVPSSTFQITITLYPHRPLAYAALRACLTGAHKKAKRPQNAKFLTPNRCMYYPNSNHKPASNDAPNKPPLQFGIAGDLLWGKNQLFWGDVADILVGLIQWSHKRKEDGKKGVEFSFSVSEGDGDGKEGGGKKGRGEIATGYVRRKAEYLDHGAFGREREVRYDAFRVLFGIRRVDAK